ncbi:alginate O-acetyltransferase AlgX-related protein [Deinococcus cellulosilyticus]|uniref:Alginate O-acetyltransferase n=1 Tax=Deinococcus cellulosilyticus (strain DSM 18568 / NBRC 106333 / KACC 11606 / 5516J-15) TaxID=1223518 RepID=A0A511N3K4_DEIC1|nr:hypothetical protein [Deinococcus cellulosilyticus]GEM47006.1 alginate O-acetyltransferase [Deinococcus cellulosilyticus NBRC 106333 = KACC 11606]
MIQNINESTSVPATTQHAHPHLQLIPGIFMLGFLTLGAVFALISPGLRDLPEGKDVITGEWAVTYEKTFNKGLPWRDTGIQAWGTLEYFAFQNGRPGVLVGKEGWLFTTEEFQFFKNEAQETRQKLETIQQVQQQLKAQGTELVVALIPAKTRVYADKLGRYPMPSYTLKRYFSFRDGLLQAGIPAPDLLTPLIQARNSGEVFLHTDTHWTPFGASVVAESVKTALDQLQLNLPTTAFETRDSAEIQHSGDLLKYIPLGPYQDQGPQPDHFTEKVTEQASTDSSALLGDAPDDASDLLGDSAGVPVALVGTSYSFNPKFHFEGALKQALQVDVLNMALEGKGPMVPMQEYLKSSAWKDTPPKVVVWEIPERFLPVHYEETP